MRNVFAAIAGAACVDRDAVRVVDGDGREWTNGQLASCMFAVRDAAERHAGSRVVVATRSAGAFWACVLGVTGAGADAVLVPEDAPKSLRERVRAELSPACLVDDSFLAALPRGESEDGLSVNPVGDGGVILLSSGTTGRSRFVRRSARAVGLIAEGLCGAGLYGVGDRCCAMLPLHHAYGFEHSFLGPALGGCRVQHGHRFDPAEVRASILTSTVLATVPAALRALLEAGFPQGCVRRIITAGTSLSPLLRQRLNAAAQGIELIDLYGATELGTIWLDRGDGGLPVAGVEVRIGSGDAEGRGELFVRSASRLDGFVGMQECPVDADGWFRTGDLGTNLPGGGFAIVGRSKLVFDVGGLKVNPHDVEAALEEHPSVRAAIVSPVKVAEDLVRVGATIEVVGSPGGSRPSATDLRQHLRERVAVHAIPRSFEFVDRLPRTPSGKVLRQTPIAMRSAASPMARRRGDLADVEVRRRWTTRLFDDSADGYDWSSAAGALWTDRWYRRRQLRASGLRSGGAFLDVGGGTGRGSAVAMEIVGSQGRVVLVDPSPGMGAVARARGVQDVRAGFAEALPVEDCGFDVVLLGYMLRHVEDMDAAFAEAFRALRPMGRICILEVSEPIGAIGRTVFRFAAGRALPLISRIGSRRAAVGPMMAYWAETMADAAAPSEVLAALTRAGFVGTRHRRELGIFSSYRGVKPASP